jgi:hypothetical protein
MAMKRRALKFSSEFLKRCWPQGIRRSDRSRDHRSHEGGPHCPGKCRFSRGYPPTDRSNDDRDSPKTRRIELLKIIIPVPSVHECRDPLVSTKDLCDPQPIVAQIERRRNSKFTESW